jgi:hypothetical protein
MQGFSFSKPNFTCRGFLTQILFWTDVDSNKKYACDQKHNGEFPCQYSANVPKVARGESSLNPASYLIPYSLHVSLPLLFPGFIIYRKETAKSRRCISQGHLRHTSL